MAPCSMRWAQQELPSLDWISLFQPPITSTKTVGQTHARGPSHTLGTEQASGQSKGPTVPSAGGTWQPLRPTVTGNTLVVPQKPRTIATGRMWGQSDLSRDRDETGAAAPCASLQGPAHRHGAEPSGMDVGQDRGSPLWARGCTFPHTERLLVGVTLKGHCDGDTGDL